MNKAELIQEVVTITGRPDLGGMAKSAVQSAVLEAHSIDFFAKDLTEALVTFGSESIGQVWGYQTNFPRFRALTSARIADSLQNKYQMFTKIEPSMAVDNYGYDMENVYYLAGNNINFRGANPFKYIWAVVCNYPDITDSSFSSWIAREHPYMIVHLACAKVFRSIGDQLRMRGQDELVLLSRQQLMATAITVGN